MIFFLRIGGVSLADLICNEEIHRMVGTSEEIIVRVKVVRARSEIAKTFYKARSRKALEFRSQDDHLKDVYEG